jgi:predicted dehydrogenase
VSAPLGVAVVGAGPDHWSATAHLPAIAALDDVALHAVVTSSPESAAAAADRWGVAATHELERVLDDPDVDVVAVTVRVPRHAEIVEAAIAAGKHVYCEWPLAVDTAEARTLAALSASRPDRVHVVGLQGRFSPHLRTAGELIADGRIGRPLTANLRLYLPHGLVPRPAHRAHLRHRTVGANVLTIQGGHALDMLRSVLGPARVSPISISGGRMWAAVPEFVVDTGERLPRDAQDNAVALLDLDGVVAVTQFSQTGPAESCELEILGTAGMLRLRSHAQPQFGGLTLDVTPLGAGAAEPVELRPALAYASPLPAEHPGHNVASAYAALAWAVRTSVVDPVLPRFADAVDLHELLEDIAQEALTRA